LFFINEGPKPFLHQKEGCRFSVKISGKKKGKAKKINEKLYSKVGLKIKPNTIKKPPGPY